MDTPRVLSGQAIVAKGVTKIEVSLPVIGLKDVTPNGSWLEEKQVQAALEARKHLIEVERIEKFGTLSHATWRDDLKLAEVTQMAGSYWQYLGHNVGKTLYLNPEEALFLMEINCLLLKHNDVTVSLQKAYSLLLNETMSNAEYRVYASLSRLGYKIFRHKPPEVNKDKSSSYNNLHAGINLENIPMPLTIDTIVADNVIDQPLTDSSVEILDSTINENIDLKMETENISQELPTPTQNDNVDENKNKNDTYENTQNDEMQVENEANIVEIAENEAKNTNNNNENNEPEHDKDKENIEHYIESQNNEPPITDDDSTKTAMDVDENTDPNTDKLSHNPAQLHILRATNELTVLTGDTVSGINEQTTAETGVHVVDSNARSSENTNIIKNDDNLSCTESTSFQEAPNSSIQENENKNLHSAKAIEVDSAASDIVMDIDTPTKPEFTKDNYEMQIDNANNIDTSLSDILMNKRNNIFHHYVTKLKKLTSRQCKPSNFKNVEKHFECIPEIFKKEVITINVPELPYIPPNIFVNKCSYVLSIQEIKKKSRRSVSNETAAYNSSDEVNGNHVRRIRSNSATEIAQNLQFVNNIRCPSRQALFFRPNNFWRPQNSYVQFNMFFQRPYQNMFFQSRFQYQQRPNPSMLRAFSFPNNMNMNPDNSNPNINTRKRLRSAKAIHLQSIKNITVRLRHLIMSGRSDIDNIEAVHSLLYAYNTRYNARLRLTKTFEVANEENIVETINLEVDEELPNKRPRLSDGGDMFEENLNVLRQLALKLKELDKDKVTPKYKRALSKAIKTFNKSYDADIYMNRNYEVINKRFINLESDSESDCVVNEPKNVHKKRKLRNPFNVLKRRSEKQAANNPSTSKENNSEEPSGTNNIELENNTKYNEDITKKFTGNWLPQENDFGRAEIVHKNAMNSRFTDSIKEEYLFNFMKNHVDKFNDWLEAKIAFLQHMDETDIAFQNDHQMMAVRESVNQSGLKPLIDAEDCTDMPSVLQKLQIIKNNKEINTETKLNIHFDVYNRDVQNFRKTNPPKPHFRIICLEESSTFPSATEVMTLHSQYEDNVNTVFAVVGTGSISYLQINPIDLPVYVANNDMD